MSEQVTNEQAAPEEKKGVVLPTVVGIGAGAGTKMLYEKAANKLALDALAPQAAAPAVAGEAAAPAAKAISADLRKGAVEAAGHGGPGSQKYKLDGARDLKGAQLSGGTISKATGEGAKGAELAFTSANGRTINVQVDKLTGEGSKLLGDKASVTLTGDQLKTLTEGGEKSWVAKTAAQAEKEVAKNIRGNEAYKKAAGGLFGSVGKTFSHASGMGKAGIVAGSVLATVGVVTGVKRMFSSHTERASAPATGTAPTR